MKKKNKGFTLIELLAVIVILGIILTIVVSNVVKYIGKAREGAFKDTYAKVLKDVSNKIALSDIDDTESVTCSVSDCAREYGVSENDILLSVYKFNEKYGIIMTGKGSYANVSLDDSTKPDNAGLIGSNTLSSIINTDGEVNANTTITNNENELIKIIDGTIPYVILDIKISNNITYVKYKESGIEKKALFDSNGKKLDITINDENFFDYYMLFIESLKFSEEEEFKSFFESKGYDCFKGEKGLTCSKETENHQYRMLNNGKCCYYYMEGKGIEKLSSISANKRITLGTNMSYNNGNNGYIFYIKQ